MLIERNCSCATSTVLEPQCVPAYDQVISLIVFDKKHSTDLLRNNLPKNAFETKIPF